MSWKLTCTEVNYQVKILQPRHCYLLRILKKGWYVNWVHKSWAEKYFKSKSIRSIDYAKHCTVCPLHWLAKLLHVDFFELLTPWNRVLENLTVARPFMEHLSLVVCSQEPPMDPIRIQFTCSPKIHSNIILPYFPLPSLFNRIRPRLTPPLTYS
jgi:hypothetical protein